ncbi:MAG TPA: D-alanyl-D-alanine carboxypeptidase [Syntrophomonas sp.]|jgi:D-alanyl-D-alanine carboxypeptidase (penicillin-binding protein 5/6)|nr:D-alanyl-D-alanine carboxypeptidase [Syntrophomonas sp.]
MGKKRYIAGLVLIFMFMLYAAPVLSAPAANNLDIKAESYVLMDADSGKVLCAQDEHKKLPPASMTKLMTLILAAEALEEGKVSLKDKVVTSENAWEMGGSQVYLEQGETMTLEDMLIAVAVGSANDASVAVAEHLEGTHQDFVDLMNKKAGMLGLKDTKFMNCYGLPAEGHYTSAYDMAVIARYALKYPRVLEYTSIKEYDLRGGEFKLYNTNKLLWWYQGADGFKTGWTNEAKYCLTATAKRNGLRLISVVMASPETRGHFRDSMELFNYGFAKYAYKTFFVRDNVCGVVKVGKGISDMVEAVAEEDIGAIYMKGEDSKISSEKHLVTYINAPVKKGQKLGEISIYKNGQLQKKVNLNAAQDIPKSGIIREFVRMFAEIFTL